MTSERKTAWTPGPWRVVQQHQLLYTTVIDAAGTTVALCDEDVALCKNGQAEANARMIAQTPMMIKLLQDAVEREGEWESNFKDDVRALLNRIQKG